MTDTTISPDNGANSGLTITEAARELSSLLDSDFTATQDDGIENEEPSETDDIEQTEQPEMDSDEAIETDDDVESEDEATPSNEITDDYEFEIDGQKVTFAELKAGNLRQSDYTIKTQELSEHRKTYDTAIAHSKEIESKTINELWNFQQQIAAQLELMPQVNLEELLQEDPGEYLRQKSILDKRQAAFQQVEAARLAMVKQVEARNQVEFAQAIKKRNEDIKAMHPEILTDANAQGMFAKWLDAAGFTGEDVDNTTDARMLSAAYKAALWDDMQAKKTQAVKIVEKKPAMVKPGGSVPAISKDRTAYQKDMARLKRSGSINDAAAALKHIL